MTTHQPKYRKQAPPADEETSLQGGERIRLERSDFSPREAAHIETVLAVRGHHKLAERIFDEGIAPADSAEARSAIRWGMSRLTDLVMPTPGERDLLAALNDAWQELDAESRPAPAGAHLPSFASAPIHDPKVRGTAAPSTSLMDREVVGSLPDGVSLKQSGYGPRGRRRR